MVSDPVPEIFFRALSITTCDPLREATPRQIRSGSGKSRSASDVATQTICITLDSAHAEGTSSPSCAAFYSAPRASLHASSHTAFCTPLRAPLRLLFLLA